MTEVINPLMTTLRARIPGESFALPSQGLFYVNGELDESVRNGEVHVFPMTGLDEIIFRTPDKLLSGEAVIDVFARCIPQIKKPADLLSKDVDYLLVCLRLLSYGPEMDVHFQHDCATKIVKDIDPVTREEVEKEIRPREHSYKVPIRPFLRLARKIDPTTLGQEFTITLDDTGQVIKMRPALYKNVIEVYQAALMAESKEEVDSDDIKKLHNEVVGVVISMIIEVDAITDRGFIEEWVRALPPMITNEIAKKSRAAAEWGLEQKTTVRCKDCAKDVEIDVPVNPISFFT